MSFLMGGADAETTTKPHNFTSGTTIRSSQVNENFDVLYRRMNETQQQIDRLVTLILFQKKVYHLETVNEQPLLRQTAY